MNSRTPARLLIAVIGIVMAWQAHHVLDTAMSRLVSLPAVLAVEWAADGRAPKGVSGAPKEPAEIDRWLQRLEGYGVRVLTGA